MTSNRRHPRRVSSRIGILDGLDVRGDGGYVVAPSSIYHSGATYEWITEPDGNNLPVLPLVAILLIGGE